MGFLERVNLWGGGGLKFVEIWSRQPKLLKLDRLIAHLIFYKICRFGSLITSLKKTMENSDLRETKSFERSWPKLSKKSVGNPWVYESIVLAMSQLFNLWENYYFENEALQLTHNRKRFTHRTHRLPQVIQECNSVLSNLSSLFKSYGHLSEILAHFTMTVHYIVKSRDSCCQFWKSAYNLTFFCITNLWKS